MCSVAENSFQNQEFESQCTLLGHKTKIENFQEESIYYYFLTMGPVFEPTT